MIAALEQVLMQHLVQQSVVVGHEALAAAWQVEGDGVRLPVVMGALTDSFSVGAASAITDRATARKRPRSPGAR